MFGPGLGWQELVLILLIVAMIFGTSKLAGIGSDLGKSIREFKKEASLENPKEGEALPEGTSATEPARTETRRTETAQMRADEI